MIIELSWIFDCVVSPRSGGEVSRCSAPLARTDQPSCSREPPPCPSHSFGSWPDILHGPTVACMWVCVCMYACTYACRETHTHAPANPCRTYNSCTASFPTASCSYHLTSFKHNPKNPTYNYNPPILHHITCLVKSFQKNHQFSKQYSSP